MSTTAWAGPSYGEMLVRALSGRANRPAMQDMHSRVTYGQLAERVSRFCRVLSEVGVAPGVGVGLLATNRIESWVVQAATQILGARFTALHPLGSLEDHSAVCAVAELDLLVVDAKFAERGAALQSAGAASNVRGLGESHVGPDLSAAADITEAGRLEAARHADDDVIWMPFTGGTTGKPKGVCHSQSGAAAAVMTMLAGWNLPETPRYLVATPISHAGGVIIVPTLLRGGTVVMQNSFDPHSYLQALDEERITVTMAVPTMIYALLELASSRPRPRTLEQIVYGAAPMSPDRLAQAVDIFGPVFTQVFGQAESQALGTVLASGDHDPARPDRLASCGRPIVGVNLALLDEAGTPTPPGEIGEICLRSPAVMRGYWKQPDLTEAALAGGWLHTGDLATADDDGFITIVDRQKDMIVTGGFNIYPREVEDVLHRHPGVALATVIGVPDARWGEAVTALVVPRAGVALEPTELIDLVRSAKGPVAAPKSVELVDSLPMTPVGKVDKRRLREARWAGQERLVH